MFIKFGGAYISKDDISRLIIRRSHVKVITEEWVKYKNYDKDLHSKHGFNIEEIEFEIVLKSDPMHRYQECLYFDKKGYESRKLYNECFNELINYERDVNSVRNILQIIDNDIRIEDYGRIL